MIQRLCVLDIFAADASFEAAVCSVFFVMCLRDFVFWRFKGDIIKMRIIIRLYRGIYNLLCIGKKH